jgi:hypothetical protein
VARTFKVLAVTLTMIMVVVIIVVVTAVSLSHCSEKEGGRAVAGRRREKGFIYYFLANLLMHLHGEV